MSTTAPGRDHRREEGIEPGTFLVMAGEPQLGRLLQRVLARQGRPARIASTGPGGRELLLRWGGQSAGAIIDLYLLGAHYQGLIAAVRLAHPRLPLLVFGDVEAQLRQIVRAYPRIVGLDLPFGLVQLRAALGQMADLP